MEDFGRASIPTRITWSSIGSGRTARRNGSCGKRRRPQPEASDKMTAFSWSGRAAFVTGATGFVGANIVRRLLEQQARVICLERDAVSANSLDMLELRPKVTVVAGALEDGALMDRVLNEHEIDAVFHLGAQTL